MADFSAEFLVDLLADVDIYEVKRSQCHLLAAFENNWLEDKRIIPVVDG